MKLKEIRERKNITQEELAKKLSVTRQAVSRWENQKTQPDIDTLVKLAKIYNCTIDELIMCDERINETIIKQNSIYTFDIYLIMLPFYGFIYSITYFLIKKKDISHSHRTILITRITLSLLSYVSLVIFFCFLSKL